MDNLVGSRIKVKMGRPTIQPSDYSAEFIRSARRQYFNQKDNRSRIKFLLLLANVNRMTPDDMRTLLGLDR